MSNLPNRSFAPPLIQSPCHPLNHQMHIVMQKPLFCIQHRSRGTALELAGVQGRDGAVINLVGEDLNVTAQIRTVTVCGPFVGCVEASGRIAFRSGQPPGCECVCVCAAANRQPGSRCPPQLLDTPRLALHTPAGVVSGT